MKNHKETSLSGFEFLPANASSNCIEVFPPFAQLVNEHFGNTKFDISFLETGSITISLEEIDLNTKNIFLKDLKVFLKKSRQQIIDDFIYKGNGINYL